MFTLFLTGVIGIGVLLLAQAGVRRLPIAKHFRKINDIVGFYMNLIGVIYAVVLTFVMVVVWEDFQDASRIVEAEANALQNIYLLAEGLAEPKRSEIRHAAFQYAEKAVKQEWPMMADEKRPTSGDAVARSLWTMLTTYDPKNPREQLLMEQLLSARVELQDQRQQRLHEATHRIPDILWLVLLYGGLSTIGLCFMFGVEQAGLHQFKTALTGSFIILIMFAIWELDRPFSRNVHVSPEPFTLALEQFKQK
jgi:hypothetical protein